jgi:hypothetical protein
MSQRVTIVIDDDVNKRLRSIQSRQIKDSQKSISFSRVLNEELKSRFRL